MNNSPFKKELINMGRYSTVKAALRLLPFPANELAIANALEQNNGYHFNMPIRNRSRALALAFRWDKTPEGVKYWQDVIRQIEN